MAQGCMNSIGLLFFYP